MDKNLQNSKIKQPMFPSQNGTTHDVTVSHYEHAKFIIERFDHYYDGVNNKGTFYISLNTFIFGGICVGYLSLHDKVIAESALWILFGALVILNALSTLFTILALMPFLKNHHQEKELPSMLYFGGIAKHELAHFQEKFQKADDASFLNDLVQQVYCLASGLDGKYKKLRKAGWYVVAQFLVMLPLLFFIIKNLK